MDFSFFKFLLKNGLAFPRSKEELDYVKENVFNNDEKLETPSFEETWNYINDNQSDNSTRDLTLESRSYANGMSQAARFGGEISEETKNEMEKDKKEAKQNM